MDDLDSPQSIPVNFASHGTVGGNTHENWALIRFLPPVTGSWIPVDDLAWQILMTLKDIVELSVANLHSPESLAYPEQKISGHRHRFQELFPPPKLDTQTSFFFLALYQLS